MKRQGRVSLLYPSFCWNASRSSIRLFRWSHDELFAYAACQPVQCAYAADGEVRRFLISAVQTAEYVIYVFPRPDGVASGVYIFGIFLVLGHPAEAVKLSRMALLLHLIIYGVGGVVAVYIDIDCLFRMELRGKQIVVTVPAQAAPIRISATNVPIMIFFFSILFYCIFSRAKLVKNGVKTIKSYQLIR